MPETKIASIYDTILSSFLHIVPDKFLIAAVGLSDWSDNDKRALNLAIDQAHDINVFILFYAITC